MHSPAHIFVMPGVPKEMKLMFERDVLPTSRKRAAGGSSSAKPSTPSAWANPPSPNCSAPSWTAPATPPSAPPSPAASSPSASTPASHRTTKPNANSTTPPQQCHAALGDLIFGEDDTTLPESVAALLIVQRQNRHHRRILHRRPARQDAHRHPRLQPLFPTRLGHLHQRRQADAPRRPRSAARPSTAPSPNPSFRGWPAPRRRQRRRTSPWPSPASPAPTGGTPAKPVGTVCIALARPSKAANAAPTVITRTFLFPGDREMIRDRAAKMALTMLRFHLLGKPLPF